ncbi:MAG TPA: hypothetical protein VK852_02110, partial [Desulfobacterales bacterium]|nr:hypothetical protein [Desulfobacterales bacterium]
AFVQGTVFPAGFGGCEGKGRARPLKSEWNGFLPPTAALDPGQRRRVCKVRPKRIPVKTMKEGKDFVNMSKMK